MRPLRILHLPVNVGNQAWNLSRGERALGLASETLEFFPSTAGYPADRSLRLGRLPKPLNLARRLALLAECLWRYDALHFYYADTLFRSLADLPIFAALGKPMFFTFQGCDARLDHSRAFRMCRECVNAPCCREEGAARRTRLARIRRYAAAAFTLNPDLTELHPWTEFLPYATAIPEDGIAWRPPAAGEPWRILHAPTDRRLKGTDRLLAAVESLKAGGVPVDLVLAERLPHAEVLELARSCHAAADQFLVGWYGGFAVEMMALGLPVFAYIDPEQHRISGLPPHPFLDCPPGGIAGAMADAFARPGRLAATAAAGRAFARAVHEPRRVAARVAARYRAALGRRAR